MFHVLCSPLALAAGTFDSFDVFNILELRRVEIPKPDGRQRSGVSQMPSRRLSRSWIPFRNSELQRSWANFRKAGSAIVPARGGVNWPPLAPLALPASVGLYAYTMGNVDGRHSATIKFLEGAG
jgi:hypothetical protein